MRKSAGFILYGKLYLSILSIYQKLYILAAVKGLQQLHKHTAGTNAGLLIQQKEHRIQLHREGRKQEKCLPDADILLLPICPQ